MVATRQATGHSKPKVWHDEVVELLPVTRSDITSSSASAAVAINPRMPARSAPSPRRAVFSTVELVGVITKLIPKITKLANDVRPFVLKQEESSGVLIMRQDYGWVRLQEMESDIALTVTPILKTMTCSLSTGIPDLFPTKAMLRVKYACYDEPTAAAALFLPNFKSALDVVESMFCDDYKDKMLQRLRQHMLKVERELSTMKTWVEEPKKTLAFLRKQTGFKPPIDCAHQVPAITCTDCLHDVSQHWHVYESSFRFECPEKSFKKQKLDDTTRGNERNVHEFLCMDRRLAFIDHPVLDESIVMMRRSAKILHFLAADEKFDVNSREGRVVFEEVVKLFKNSKLHASESEEHEASLDDVAPHL